MISAPLVITSSRTSTIRHLYSNLARIAVLICFIICDHCNGANEQQQETSPNHPLSELDKKLLADSTSCLNTDRLDTIYNYYAVTSATDRRAERVSMFENTDFFRMLIYNESDFRVRYKGSRIFSAVEDVVEYLALGNGDLNGGGLDVLHTAINNVKCESEDVVNVNVDITIYIKAKGGDVLSMNPDKHIFAPSSDLLMQVDTFVPDAVIESVQDASIPAQAFCDAAVLKCPAEFYPYKNLQDCYDTVVTIPKHCEEGVNANYTGGIVQGDTMACRSLHLLSAGIRPAYHCPHLRNISKVCQPIECPSAVRLTAVEGSTPFDAGHSIFIRILELVTLALFMTVFFCSFFWYKKKVNSIDSYCNSSPDNRLHRRLSSPASSPLQCENILPSLAFKDLKLSWANGDTEDDIALHWDNGYLGGCTFTCMTGESGSGKTSFIKLLCGFDLAHMNLTCGEWVRRDPIAFCPQSSEMWPNEMIVKNILVFACALSNVEPDEYNECFQVLGLDDLMDQAFGTLSGGQKQRVNIAAAIVRPTPALVFLDEPLAALDEDSALACLQVLKDLPVDHSFVMTVHNASPKIASMFDRMIHFDGKEVCSMIEKKRPAMVPVFAETGQYRKEQHVSWSKIGSIKASYILWFGQFYGLPLVEMLTTFWSVIGAILIGYLGRKSTAGWDSTYFPTEESVRVPFYVADVLVGLGFVTSFGVSLVYANRERMLVKHFTTVRLLDSNAYLLVLLLFRSMVHGIIQASCYIFIAIPVLGFSAERLDILFVNTAIFGFAWTGMTFGTAIMVSSPFYSSHAVLVMDLMMVFFCGIFFFMSKIYYVFKLVHYLNPLFYTLSANSFVLATYMLKTGCKDKQHPGECASGPRILEMDDITPFTSLTAQGLNFIFAFLFFGITLFHLIPRDNIKISGVSDTRTTGEESSSLSHGDIAPDASMINRRAHFKNSRSTAKSVLFQVQGVSQRRSMVEWKQVSSKNLSTRELNTGMPLSKLELFDEESDAFEA